MKKRVRVLRFGSVGIAATAIHYVMLYGLEGCGLQLAFANTIAFLTAVLFSFYSQQKITFADRLKGRRLGGRAFLAVVTANAAINAGGGAMISAFGLYSLKVTLPILAACTNFILYSLATASSAPRPEIAASAQSEAKAK